jgi:hypothetical protein
MTVYDKAKWHFEGDFPGDLLPFQGYIHTGMFLGWCIENNLVSDIFKTDLAKEIAHFKQQKLTGSEIYEQCCDGVLMSEDLNDTGNAFAKAYFDFETGAYLADYEKTLGMLLPSIYHVADTWDNYYALKQVIDERFREWQAQQQL